MVVESRYEEEARAEAKEEETRLGESRPKDEEKCEDLRVSWKEEW